MTDQPPAEAMRMFNRRYSKAKADGVSSPNAKEIAKGVASDYLNIYVGTGWTWNHLFRAILSVSGSKGTVAKARKKAAKARRDRDTGDQQYMSL